MSSEMKIDRYEYKLLDDGHLRIYVDGVLQMVIYTANAPQWHGAILALYNASINK
jgi:hypothetical protein